MDLQALGALVFVCVCVLYVARRFYLMVTGKGSSACHGCPSGDGASQACCDSAADGAPDRSPEEFRTKEVG